MKISYKMKEKVVKAADGIMPIAQIILHSIYPFRCPGCDQILHSHLPHELCTECKKKIIYIKEPYCMRCGKQILVWEEEYCHDCQTRKHSYEWGRALCDYQSVQSSVQRMKQGGRKETAEYWASAMAEGLSESISRMHADCLVPVPTTMEKYLQRGYNPSEELAVALGKALGIKVERDLIKRRKKGISQKALGAQARQNNLKKAFIIMQNDVKLESIIVVDDVYTTGSTIDAIASLCKEAGIAKVYFVTLAIGKGY